MKALVVYGSRYGTAAEIAQEVARVIKDEGVEVGLEDARGIKDCDVSPYDLVVVGSGIKIGKWTSKSLKFLKDNRSSLANRKVAIFVSCGAANEESSRAEGQEKYLDEVAAKNLINEPLSTGLFGSVYDPEANHGLMFKMVNRSVRKNLQKQGIDPSKRLDYRDWGEIRSWARGLVDKLKNDS